MMYISSIIYQNSNYMTKVSGILVILCIVLLYPIQAQKRKTVTSKGTAQVELIKSKSRLEIEKQVEEQATLNALEKAFGRIIIQGNSTYIENVNSGEKVETYSEFDMIANSMVKGEVVEVIDKKFTDIPGSKTVDKKKEDIIFIQCDIKIKARELVKPKIEFVSYPLSCEDRRCKTISFQNEDDLFLYFKSPIKGYLSVFLDDNINAFRLLPYQNMSEEYDGGIKIDADNEYIFFSTKKENNYFENDYFVEDNYILVTESAQELNKIIIVLSKQPIDKPFLEESSALAKNGEQYSVPKNLDSEKFQEWLQNNRIARSNIQVETILITITKD